MNAVIAYYCPSSGETYLLVVKKSLCVTTMDINLIPSFVLGEVGLILNNMLIIHCEYPSVGHHSLVDKETGMRIPFTFNGTFLTFEPRSLTEDEIENA